MKLGVAAQILSPLLQEGKLLMLRVAYVNDPSTARPLWIDRFESGMIHGYFSIIKHENGEHSADLEEGWENPELWSGMIVAGDKEYQHCTKDELLVLLRGAVKAQHASRNEFFAQLSGQSGPKVMQ